MVIPVPTLLQRDQIHVGDKRLVDHLDAYSAPRLVEYFDGDPCRVVLRESLDASAPLSATRTEQEESRNRALGVSIEASYTVGEYDILILSARQSGGLETWLTENGYRIPAGASDVLGSYIKQDMRFFVARVNLEEQSSLGFSCLRPLQIAYESSKFMLPIRLGMVNANGPQDLFVYTLTRNGRVETTNYRTVKLPTDVEVPLFLKNNEEFGNFYQAMFDRRVEQENRRGVFLEYAWGMGWCDPCATDPPTNEELTQLGVFWETQDVFITRLHVRYDADHFPDDLRFQETGDRANFQGRYVLRHPWMGAERCDAAAQYRQILASATRSRLKRWRRLQAGTSRRSVEKWVPMISTRYRTNAPGGSGSGNGNRGTTAAHQPSAGRADRDRLVFEVGERALSTRTVLPLREGPAERHRGHVVCAGRALWRVVVEIQCLAKVQPKWFSADEPEPGV